MARYDKYEPLANGYRARLASNWSADDLNKVCPVSLDANGRVVKGTAGQSGFGGVLVLQKIRNAGDVVDVMTSGEIVELTGLSAGTAYYASTNGSGLETVGEGLFKVGHTVEANRLVVRCNLTGLGVPAEEGGV